jgi:ferredoxin-NADP reductase
MVLSRRAVSLELWVMRLAPEERVAFSPGQYVTIGLAAA